jgi:hypothetical protein
MFKDSFHCGESGFCISGMYHRSIFRSEVIALRTHARPTSELQTRGGLSYAIMTIRCRWRLITSTNATSAEIGQHVLSGRGRKSQEIGNCTRLIPARSRIESNDRLIYSQIPNSTRSDSADTERDDVGDVRLAIEDDRSRRRDRVSSLASLLPGAIWRSLGL